MGTAIAEGAVRAGCFAPEQVLMFNRSEKKRAAHAAKGYAVTGDYTEVYAESEIVLLAVKPQNSTKSCQIWRNMKGRSRLSYPLPQA